MRLQPVRAICLLSALLLPLLATPVLADASLAPAIQRLGDLNGTALACQQTALATRVRDIIIEYVPKERQMGERFEAATQQRYLAIGREAQRCPDSRSLVDAIEQARQQLLSALGEKR